MASENDDWRSEVTGAATEDGFEFRDRENGEFVIEHRYKGRGLLFMRVGTDVPHGTMGVVWPTKAIREIAAELLRLADQADAKGAK